MEPLRPWLVPFLLPEHCFDQFFLRLQLLDGAGGASGGDFGAFRGVLSGILRCLYALWGRPPCWLRAGIVTGRRHLGFGRGKGSAAIFVLTLRRHRRHLCFGCGGSVIFREFEEFWAEFEEFLGILGSHYHPFVLSPQFRV